MGLSAPPIRPLWTVIRALAPITLWLGACAPADTVVEDPQLNAELTGCPPIDITQVHELAGEVDEERLTATAMSLLQQTQPPKSIDWIYDESYRLEVSIWPSADACLSSTSNIATLIRSEEFEVQRSSCICGATVQTRFDDGATDPFQQRQDRR